MFVLIKNNDNGYKRIENVSKKLSSVNTDFIDFVNGNNINSVNLTSVGNSIATGYSMNDSIKPLLLRNEDLINRCNFDLNLRGYARAQDNNDEHIFDWFLNNYTQSDINKKVQLDFIHEKGMPHKTISEDDVLKFYPTQISDDIGLKDLVCQGGEDFANIIVYNGVTGSFLDNVTRHGMHKSLYGFKRDLVSLESSLKLIYLLNPYTQVYVCGMPNILGLHVTDLINKDIKRVCKMYPNCCYVSPVFQNFVYMKDGKLVFDVHYNQDEYLNLNKNILEAIIHNYIPMCALTEFDIVMKKYSDVAQYGDRADITRIIDDVFSKYDLSDDQLKRIGNYFKERYPYDFYYTPRCDVIEDINSRKSK